MDITHLRPDWTNWVPHLQTHFPHTQIPDIFPQGALLDGLVERLSKAHDLTVGEVTEIMDEMCMLRAAHNTTSRAA